MHYITLICDENAQSWCPLFALVILLKSGRVWTQCYFLLKPTFIYLITILTSYSWVSCIRSFTFPFLPLLIAAGTLVTWLEQRQRNGCSSPATPVALSSSEPAQVRRTPSLSRSETERASSTTALGDWTTGATSSQAGGPFKHLGWVHNCHFVSDLDVTIMATTSKG